MSMTDTYSGTHRHVFLGEGHERNETLGLPSLPQLLSPLLRTCPAVPLR
jgi:hypothetical protein